MIVSDGKPRKRLVSPSSIGGAGYMNNLCQMEGIWICDDCEMVNWCDDAKCFGCDGPPSHDISQHGSECFEQWTGQA